MIQCISCNVLQRILNHSMNSFTIMSINKRTNTISHSGHEFCDVTACIEHIISQLNWKNFLQYRGIVYKNTVIIYRLTDRFCNIYIYRIYFLCTTEDGDSTSFHITGTVDAMEMKILHDHFFRLELFKQSQPIKYM